MRHKLHSYTQATLVAILPLALIAGPRPSLTVGKPVRQFDVGSASTPLRKALTMPVRHIQLEFLGDSRVAIASLDDFGVPETNPSPRKKFHLTIDVVPVDATREPVSQARFETETVDSKLAVLPSGRAIVSVSRELLLLDESLHVMARSTVERVCALETDLPSNEGYIVSSAAASEDIAVVGFQPVIGRTMPPKEKGHWCWFSTIDLHPLKRVQDFSSSPHFTARDFRVYIGTTSISPEGTKTLALPNTNPPCKVPFVMQSFPDFFLLHAEDAAEFKCHKGAISILRGDKVTSIPLSGGDGFWYIRADAFNAPLATFVSGGARVPMFGGPPTGQAAIRMVNYDTGVSAAVPGGISAISPSGKYFASLQGPMLYVYETPRGLRESFGRKGP